MRFEFRDVFDIPCGDFNAEFDDWIKGSITIFSDGNNNPNEYVGHLRFKGTITNSETGQVFKDHGVINFSGNLPAFDDVDENVRGVWFHINVPGEGVVTLVVGRLVIDEEGNAIFTSGKNVEEHHEQPFSKVCEGLAGL